MTTAKNLDNDVLEELTTFPDEETVRKAFGTERNAPDIRVLQSGLIAPGVTYVLVSGKTPYTQDVFYAVNVSRAALNGGIENWLASGVFWTHHEAKSYIYYLKSGGARF
jgi:hypothetical protein